MTGVPIDKYLAGPQIASSQSIMDAINQALAPRDEAINGAFQQLAAKVQQLEAALGQVALAAQQSKLSPFEVALKALTHCTKDNEGLAPDAEGRCYDKSFAVIERWLDAALATSEAGSGDAAVPEKSEQALHAEVQEEPGASCLAEDAA